MSLAIQRIIIFLFLFLGVGEFPNHAADNSHDAGSQAALEYYVQQHRVFGADIIQNVGPYGYLSYPTVYTGILDTQKLILNIFLTIVFCLIAILIGVQLKSRILLIIWFFSLIFFKAPDVFHYVLVVMLGYQLLNNSRKLAIILNQIFFFTLALLSLMKGTLLFISIGTVGIFIILKIVEKRQLRVVAIAGSYFVYLIALWCMAGQSLGSLIKYPAAVLSFSSGYNYSMAVYESYKVFTAGFVGLLIITCLILRNLLAFRTNLNHAAFSLVLIPTIYAGWKHGFVRADLHVLTFFYLIIPIFILVKYGHREEALHA